MGLEGSTTSTSFTPILTFTPVTAGNHMTITALEMEGRVASGTALFHYRFNYADGATFTSIDYPATSLAYTTLADATVHNHCNFRGTVASVVVEAMVSSGGGPAFGRLTVSGYETGPTGLTASKPILGRSVSGSTTSTTFTPIAVYTPLTTGHILTPTELELEGQISDPRGIGQFRYRVTYADGTSVVSNAYGTNSTVFATLVNPKIEPHCSYRDAIVSIVLEAAADSSRNTATGRLTVFGFESVP
jgi:hypothetical protein